LVVKNSSKIDENRKKKETLTLAQQKRGRTSRGGGLTFFPSPPSTVDVTGSPALDQIRDGRSSVTTVRAVWRRSRILRRAPPMAPQRGRSMAARSPFGGRARRRVGSQRRRRADPALHHRHRRFRVGWRGVRGEKWGLGFDRGRRQFCSTESHAPPSDPSRRSGLTGLCFGPGGRGKTRPRPRLGRPVSREPWAAADRAVVGWFQQAENLFLGQIST